MRAARSAQGMVAAIAFALFATGCGGAPVTPEKARLAEHKLLSPFLQKRTVVCNDLLVEITPNFHLNVSNPGVDRRLQRFDRVQKQALVEKVWSNLTGSRAGWFTVTIGEVSDPTDVSGMAGPRTIYKVMNQFSLHVRERGEMTLSARATGPLVAVEDAGTPARNVKEFAIVNGFLEK